MGKAGQFATAEVGGGKKGKRTAYLVAVRRKREAIRVYAVVATSAEAALAHVDVLTEDGMETEVVGALSRDLTRSLGLKPGEMRLV
ncbi:hypothetical protein LOK46_14050 [Methylobacterium sp. NMS14P]|uniref:hypothetical protein n=1 Tax=Methylobacterium sp. NMS14P TaxID=2894310 RepID=UPI0023594E19|nr:hypothetical protein [Methylobacterium sp. NMS14P]WCS27896.1 hypothetical protein LOK46_14050 [Methylobacterium sp. NMS14P]